MEKLYIFNCDHEYALAQDGKYYTPPKSVVRLRANLCLTPALFAEEHSCILVPSEIQNVENLLYYDYVEKKHIKIVRQGCSLAKYIPVPWGWNNSVRQMLIDRDVNPDLLPTEENLKIWRQLAHRRTTIDFLKHINYPYTLPCELFSLEDVEQWCRANHGGFLKAPWSSSGRGIYRALHGWRDDIAHWVKGVLRKQKSIVAEIDCRKIFDFATEWHIDGGNANFIGYSVFSTDDHSQYRQNRKGSQQQLQQLIAQASCGKWNEEMLSAQKLALEHILGSAYSGPLGIDCLVGKRENVFVNPCVEINLRHTMGMVEIWNEENSNNREWQCGVAS